MTINEAIRVLEQLNRWRKGKEKTPPPVGQVSIAIETVINHHYQLSQQLN